jgi:hypothetical protein
VSVPSQCPHNDKLGAVDHIDRPISPMASSSCGAETSAMDNNAGVRRRIGEAIVVSYLPYAFTSTRGTTLCWLPSPP